MSYGTMNLQKPQQGYYYLYSVNKSVGSNVASWLE